MTSLFNNRHQPLAHRLRPATLEDWIGHEELLGLNQPLRVWIQKDELPSVLFWGPPGCGKTTLAQIIGTRTRLAFKEMHAASTGVKDTRETIEEATRRLEAGHGPTLVFMDEAHRLNRAQQDAWLAAIEAGKIIWIGATTENPSFELLPALLSRLRVFSFKPYSISDITQMLNRALTDPNVGLARQFTLDPAAIDLLAKRAQGDARRALNQLEALAAIWSHEGFLDVILAEKIAVDIQSLHSPDLVRFDSKGEDHFDLISAFIKSMRASDPHAAVYYLARMISGGEDPLFIARRMVIFASEDIGTANPEALTTALNVKSAVEFVGLPEARISLAHGTLALAQSPKDNAAYRAIERAMSEVQQNGALSIPMHLRNAATAWMKEQGYGVGYYYPHTHSAESQTVKNLPKHIENFKFF